MMCGRPCDLVDLSIQVFFIHWIPVASNSNVKAEPAAPSTSWWNPSGLCGRREESCCFCGIKGRTGDLLTSLNLNWIRFLCRGALSVMCKPFVLLDQVDKIISVNRVSFGTWMKWSYRSCPSTSHSPTHLSDTPSPHPHFPFPTSVSH